MNLAELTEQIRAIRDRMTREGHGRQADPGPAHDVSKALDMAAEELQVAREELQRQDEALRASQWALDEERRRYQDLFEHAPDAYLVTDAQGVIREANQRAVGLFNLRRRFLIGKPLVLFVVEEARPAFRSELHRLAMAPGVGRYEFRMGPRHEPAFDAEVTAVAAFADGGRSIAVRWAVRDVTGR